MVHTKGKERGTEKQFSVCVVSLLTFWLLVVRSVEKTEIIDN